MLGVTTCQRCGSSRLRPYTWSRPDPYNRQHYKCQDCGAQVNVSTLTLHESSDWWLRWITGNDGTVLVVDCVQNRRWQQAASGGMTAIERDLINYRLDEPEGELERAGRLVIRRE